MRRYEMKKRMIAVLLPAVAGVSFSAAMGADADGTWGTAGGSWTTPSRWSGSIIATGVGRTANLTGNIVGTCNISVDVARTIGSINIGDTDATGSYIINTGAAGTLAFNNSTSAALLNSVSTGKANTFNVPIILASDLIVSNFAAASSTSHALTIAGGITTSTGTTNLTLNANSFGSISLATASVNNSGTITNSGTGSGTTTISGGIGSNVTGIYQTSSTSALVISTTAMNAMAIASSGLAPMTISGGVIGAHDLTLKADSSGAINVSGASVNNTGKVQNTGSGAGLTTIDAVLGTNVTDLFQNSANSVLLLKQQNTFGGNGTYVQNGTLSLGTSSTINGGGVLVSGPVGVGTFKVGSATGTAVLQTNIAAGTPRTMNNHVSLDGDFAVAANGGGINSARVAFDVVGTLSTPNTITLTRTNQITVNTGVILDLIGEVNGSGFGLTKQGPGILNLGNGSDSKPNTFSGLTTVSAGSLVLGKSANVNAIAGDLRIDGGTVSYQSTKGEQIGNSSAVTVNSGGTLALGGNTETIGSLTLTGGSITGTTGGTLIVTGSASISGGTLTVSNLATGSGGLALGSGVAAGSVTTLNGNVSFNGATTGATLGNSAITLNGNRIFNVALGTSGADLTVTGGIADGVGGPHSLTKTGLGTLILAAGNSYAGDTIVSQGSLAGTGTIGSVVVKNGSTLKGTLTTGAITIEGGGIFATGNSPGLTVATGNVAINTDGNFNVDLIGTTPVSGYDVTRLTSATAAVALGDGTVSSSNAILNLSIDPGLVLVGGEKFVLFDNLSSSDKTNTGLFKIGANTLSEGEIFSVGARQFQINYNAVGGLDASFAANDVVLTAIVPEPAAVALCAASLSILTLRRRRRGM